MENLTEETRCQVYALNEEVSTIYGYKNNDIIRSVEELFTYGSTIVGYRAGCGKIDNTYKSFLVWKRVLKVIKKDGIIVNQESLIVPNKSPTMAGGFWNEHRYFLK